MKSLSILGYSVRVVEVERVSAAIENIDGEFIQADPGGKYFGVIRIDRSLSEKRKRLVVLHEFMHALNDILWHEAKL